MATKSLEWAHELEWRLARNRGAGLVAVPIRVIDAVVLGLRTPDSVRSKIWEWSRRRPKPLAIYQVVKQSTQYELNIEPASP